MNRNKLSNKKCLLSIIILLFLVAFSNAYAQGKKIKLSREEYIKTYRALAIEQMEKYKVPASITLGQGILESDAGNSQLAVMANNHFGIKCGGDWKGPSIRKRDDGPNDCFRKYKNAKDSYIDHSLFLTGRPRYSSLFSYEVTDYKSWARGLQKAGYATDKAYANKLIKIIEDNQLYQYDKKGSWKDAKRKEPEKPYNYWKGKHTPYKTQGLVYIIGQSDDTYEAVAAEFGFKAKDLYKYNEVPEGFPIQAGDLIYFQKKKKKANKPYYEHVVKVGESMYSISQLYGVQVKSLYKINKQNSEYIPTEGDVLRLR